MQNPDYTTDIKHNVLAVEASAGSGKTYALAKRYIQLLLDPKVDIIPLRHILAITFTNRASFEMKERILEFLKKVSLDTFSSKEERDDILSSLPIREKIAIEKAQSALDYLIRNYDFFQVQTIDSFIHSLLIGFSFILHITPNFIIRSNPEEYLEYNLDWLTDKIVTDPKMQGIFENFLEQFLFIENKQTWLPKQDILKLVSSLFSVINVYGGSLKKYEVKSKEVILKKRNTLKLIADLNNKLPEGTNLGFSKSLNKFVELNRSAFSINDLSDYFNRTTFPINKKYHTPLEISKIWKSIRKKLKQLCEWHAFSLYNCYIDIFNELYKGIEELSKKDDILFLEELNRKAHTLFTEKDITADEIYCRLAATFKHILIDEFQDTSILQWKNLVLLIKEALLHKGTFFYVGDKKQAIYRFRGGEASLFDNIKNELTTIKPKRYALNRNYRSQKAIVEFNNTIFSNDNLRRFINESIAKNNKNKASFGSSDIEDIISVFRGTQQTYRDDKPFGYVRAELIDGIDREKRDAIVRDKLLEIITELKERFSYSDLAILTRSNDEVERITAWLVERDIPVSSDKTLNIIEHVLIKELVSFLKFLHSPIDDIFFVSFISGKIFQKACDVSREKMLDFVFEGNKQKDKTNMYKRFQLKYSHIWNRYISEFFKSAGIIPIYEFTVSILRKFEVMKNFPESQGFIMRFLELIKEQESEYTNLGSFLEFFEKAEDDDLYVDMEDSDAIRVLTIHQSKGLEFGVVILPFLTINVKPGTAPSRGRSRAGITHSNSYTVDYKKGHKDLQLVYLSKKYSQYSNLLKELYKEEYKKALIDEMNSVYVALTRAEKELYVFIPNKDSKAFNMACRLISIDREKHYIEKGNKRDYKKVKATSQDKTFKIPISEHNDWLPLIKEGLTASSEIMNRREIQKGDVLHFIFSFIGNLYKKNVDLIVKKAIEKARFRYPYENNLSEYESLVKKVINGPKAKPFFFIKEGSLFQEKEIVNASGETKRIDRLIVKPDECYIIDYKSSRVDSDKHYKQLNEYRNIVQEIYPKAKIKCYLIYLDELSVEEV